MACVSVHARQRTCSQFKTDQCQCTSPFGWTVQPEKSPKPVPHGRQVPSIPKAKTSPDPKSRKKIARLAHLTPHSFGGRRSQSFPSPRRWMPQVREGYCKDTPGRVFLVSRTLITTSFCRKTRSNKLPSYHHHYILWVKTKGENAW